MFVAVLIVAKHDYLLKSNWDVVAKTQGVVIVSENLKGELEEA